MRCWSPTIDMARQAEYKPLLFTTTMRNPQRIKAMLWVLKNLTDVFWTTNLLRK